MLIEVAPAAAPPTVPLSAAEASSTSATNAADNPQATATFSLAVQQLTFLHALIAEIIDLLNAPVVNEISSDANLMHARDMSSIKAERKPPPLSSVGSSSGSRLSQR